MKISLTVVAFLNIFMVVYGDHECGQLGGTCMFTNYPCYGVWDAGLCLGPATRQCCVHYPSRGKTLDPACTDRGGVCQMSDKACAGHYDLRVGLCSGPADRVCCIEEHDDPFAEFTRPPDLIVDGQIGMHVEDKSAKGGDTLDIRWQDICGIPGDHMKTGLHAARGSWPWQALVWTRTAEGKFCSGSLVAPNYVLTSASCIKKIGEEGLVVRLAETDIYKKEGSEAEYDVAVVYVHEKYNQRIGRHNLALLKLTNESVDLGRRDINTICRPNPKQTFQGKNCWTYGWRPIPNDHTSGILKQVRATTLTSRMCSRQIWGFTEGLTCTSNRQQVACMVNSGSGLVCEDGGRFFLAGVASFDESACQESEPTRVFSDVSFYLNWLYLRTRKSYEDTD